MKYLKLIQNILKKHTGIELKYLGSEHIDGELEHELNLSIFEQVEVPEDIIEQGIAIAKSHFESFREFLDFKEEVTRDAAVQLQRWPQPRTLNTFRVRHEEKLS